MWESLRDRRLGGLKFRRQHAVSRFVVDFYCATAKLVVELDGAVHDTSEQAGRDAERTDVLNRLGLTVLRFPNEEVANNLSAVLTRILTAATSPRPPSNSPSPVRQHGRGGQGGEGLPQSPSHTA